MHLRRTVSLKLIPVAALGVLLSGCFATQQDLDPIKSDISVLEKQFMEVQKDYARSKYVPGKEGAAESEMGTRISDAYTRLAAVEKRLDLLERDVAGLKSVAPAAPSAPSSETAPASPTAPEPVMIEPIPSESPEKPTPEKPEKAAEPQAPQPTRGMLDAGEVFKGAMDLYKAGDYVTAEAAFNDFLAKYPKDHLADDARFYIGEIYFARNDYARALTEYKRVVDDYPLADRVPDALYRSGAAAEELKDAAGAREFYTRVMDNYPYSEAAKKARERLDALK